MTVIKDLTSFINHLIVSTTGAAVHYIPIAGYWCLTRRDGSTIDLSTWNVLDEIDSYIKVQGISRDVENVVSVFGDNIQHEPLYKTLIPDQGCLVLSPTFVLLTVMYFALAYASGKKKRRHLVLQETRSILVEKSTRLGRLAQLLGVSLACLKLAEGNASGAMVSMSEFDVAISIEEAGCQNGSTLHIEQQQR